MAQNTDPEPTRKQPTISDRTLQGLKPPAHGRLFLRDGNPPGFGVTVTTNGVKSFVLDYRIFNRNRRMLLGHWPEMSIQEARDAATDARKKVRENRDPLLTRNESTNLRTVHELAKEYMEKHAMRYKRASSAKTDRATLATIIRPHLGDHAVSAVTREHIQKLHADLEATPYRANRVLALLRKMFNLAIEWHATNPVWRSDNPAIGVKMYPEEKRSRWLDEKQSSRLKNVLDSYEDQKSANAIQLIALTGSRKGEALQAKWADIDFTNRLWRKPSAHTKQKREEFVPLSSDAVKLLERMKKSSNDSNEYLFPGHITGRPLQDLKSHWAVIRERAKLPGLRIHDLRHNFASLLVSSGTPIAIVGKLLGHTQMSTTERYAHISQEPQRAAAESFGKAWSHAKKTSK